MSSAGRAGAPRALCVASVLVLAVAALYLPTARHGFVAYDDPEYVAANPHVLEGLSPAGLAWAWTAFDAGNWHPLTWLSHMLDVQLFGPASGPMHLVSAGLHALNAVLLFLFLARATAALGPAALTALLFAVHPLRVESVAWIAERKDVLAGTFFFATLLAYERAVRSPGRARWLAVAVALALGLCAKPMLVTLPLVLLAVDFWPLARLRAPAAPPAPVDLRARSIALRARSAALLREKLPLLVLSGVAALLTLRAQSAGGSVRSLAQVAPLERIAGALQGAAIYLGQALWPVDLGVFYPHPAFLAGAEFAPLGARTVASAVLLVCLSLGAWRARRRLPMLLAGWSWYLVMLLPVCGLVQVGLQLHADRYTYLPLVGPTIAVVYGLHAALPRAALRPALGLGLLAALALGLATRRQVAVWHDTRTLCEHTLVVAPEAFAAHEHLGLLLQTEGDLEGARAHYRAAIALAPELPGAHGNLAALEAQRGAWEEARRELAALARLAPDHPQTRIGLAVLALHDGDPEGALAHLADLDPASSIYPDVLRNRAEAHARRGDACAALACLEECLRLVPEDGDSAAEAAWIRATGPDPACRDGARALDLAARAEALGSPRAAEVRAAALARAGRFEEAARLQAEVVSRARTPTERFLLEERRRLYAAGKAYARPR